MENIEWKDVVGFEGLYKVNNYGEIYSLYTNKKLKPSEHKDGYLIFNLRKNKKAYLMTAHRAVAMAFIENPKNLQLINHKDENKKNNFVSNLEWCDHSYNNSYNEIAKKRAISYSKTVYQYDVELNFVNKYCSVREAARQNGFSSGNIYDGCNYHKIRYGYIWSYEPL